MTELLKREPWLEGLKSFSIRLLPWLLLTFVEEGWMLGYKRDELWKSSGVLAFMYCWEV